MTIQSSRQLASRWGRHASLKPWGWKGHTGAAPRASAAKIALEHQINANLPFKWRRQYLREIAGAPAEPVKLLPVTVREYAEACGPPPIEAARNDRAPPGQRPGTIEVELPGLTREPRWPPHFNGGFLHHCRGLNRTQSRAVSLGCAGPTRANLLIHLSLRSYFSDEE